VENLAWFAGLSGADRTFAAECFVDVTALAENGQQVRSAFAGNLE
jgi:hypothetical protein